MYAVFTRSVACARLEGWGGPASASCFETDRSEVLRSSSA